MNKPLSIVWLDDDPKRQQRGQQCIEGSDLGGIQGVQLDFRSLKGKKPAEEIPKLLENTMPDLIMIDHVLDRTAGDILKNGSTIAAMIRESWPTCPIVGVSAAAKIKRGRQDEFSTARRDAYEELFPADDLEANLGSLFSIAHGFRALRTRTDLCVDDILRLLRCPKDEVERLRLIVPAELKASPDTSTPMRVSRWARHLLLRRPGFLYDHAWTANLLGLTPEGFAKVEKLFEKAKYSGIFAVDSDPRWWTTVVKEILVQRVPPVETSLPWVLGRKLRRFPAEHFSKCDLCKADYPETMATRDGLIAEFHPMHMRCSQPNPSAETMLYFDELRMMRDEQNA